MIEQLANWMTKWSLGLWNKQKPGFSPVYFRFAKWLNSWQTGCHGYNMTGSKTMGSHNGLDLTPKCITWYQYNKHNLWMVPLPFPPKNTHTHKQNETGTKKPNYFWLTIPSPAPPPPPPPSPFLQKSQIINRDWPAFQRMLRCSWLELNCLAKRWDSSRQSVYINSWEELRNWYMPWSSCCASWLGSNRWDSSTLPWWREYTVSLYEIQPHLPLWLE